PAIPAAGQHREHHGQDPPYAWRRQEAPLLPHHRHRQPQRPRRPQHRARRLLQSGRRRRREARRAGRCPHRVLARPWRADERQGRRPVQAERQAGHRGLIARAADGGHSGMHHEASAGKLILLGRIHGAFGVRGELKLESFTDPARGIFGYQPWILRGPQGARELEGARGRETAKGIVATFPGVEDRDAAEALRGTEVWAPRSALPPPGPDEYYWVDLEGLR